MCKPSTFLFFILLATIVADGQNITVDLKAMQASYETELSKDFSISFTNAAAGTKERVLLKATGLIVPLTLKEDADLSSFQIKMTASSGKLSTKDKNGKDVAIPSAGFEIAVGDKSFKVIAVAASNTDVVSNDLMVDITKPEKGYKSDYTKPINISFSGKDATPRKVSLSYSGEKGDVSVTLNGKADLPHYKILLGASEKGLTIKDEKGNDVTINTSPITITVDKVSFTVANVGKQAAAAVPQTTCSSVMIIDDKMLAKIGGIAACQLCDTRAAKVAIESKKDRIYSTDYIVIYDPLLKKDAYTICKHVFEKNGKDGYYERYIKIAPKWFQPAVGSQIRFEVINQPVGSTFKLSVNEEDVFNSGATQFAALISGLVNTNIINPVSGAAAASSSGNSKTEVAGASTDDTCFLKSLDALSNQLLEYINKFKVSSCAIEQFNSDLSQILAKINQQYGMSAIGIDDIGTQLNDQITKKITDADNKAKAQKKVAAIVSALKGLQTVTPIAYTTLRAKNRDYIEVKYIGADNIASKPENIRMSGGMKIDFSAGFVLTGLRDFTYTLKNTTVNYAPGAGMAARDTTGNVIAKEDDGNNQVGVGLLTHFYPRLSSHYNIGGTVGLMTSTSLNLRVMLGGSVLISSLFGSNNRVSFSGGVVWGKVKRLSTQYQDYYEKPRMVNNKPQFYDGTTAPTTIDKNEHSWFFAITMNFGGN